MRKGDINIFPRAARRGKRTVRGEGKKKVRTKSFWERMRLTP